MLQCLEARRNTKFMWIRFNYKSNQKGSRRGINPLAKTVSAGTSPLKVYVAVLEFMWMLFLNFFWTETGNADVPKKFMWKALVSCFGVAPLAIHCGGAGPAPWGCCTSDSEGMIFQIAGHNTVSLIGFKSRPKLNVMKCDEKSCSQWLSTPRVSHARYSKPENDFKMLVFLSTYVTSLCLCGFFFLYEQCPSVCVTDRCQLGYVRAAPFAARLNIRL